MTIEARSQYVAMGSSFASGPGIRPRSQPSPRRAMRSDDNYAHLLARRFDLDLTDVSYSGATAAQIVDGVRGRSTQIEAVMPDTQLVTVTCGGNDVHYIGTLVLASLPTPIPSLPPLRRYMSLDKEALDARFAKLRTTFDRLLAEVRRRAPRATIVLVDYLTVLPPAGQPSPPLSAEVANWAREVADRLSEETAAAASRADCLLVAASVASREHHAWSSQPWTNRFQWFRRNRAPYHPNHDGMVSIADLLGALGTVEPSPGTI